MNNKEDFNLLLTAMSVSGAIGLAVGIARGIIQQKHGSFGAMVRGAVASVLVGVVVGWGLGGMDIAESTRWSIISICAYIADDILLGLLSLAALMSRDPLGFFARLSAASRGQSVDLPKKGD